MIKLIANEMLVRVQTADGETAQGFDLQEHGVRVRVGDETMGAKLSFRWRDDTEAMSVEVDRLSAESIFVDVAVRHDQRHRELLVEVGLPDTDPVEIRKFRRGR